MKKWLSAAFVLLLLCLFLGSCGGKDKDNATSDAEKWFPGSLTETSVENPDGWYSVTAIPVE